jgi:hypothetical protein
MKTMKKFLEFITEGLIQSVDTNLIKRHLSKVIEDDCVTIDDKNKIYIHYTYLNISKAKEIHHKMTTLFGFYIAAIETDDMGEPYLENEMVLDIIEDLDYQAKAMISEHEDNGFEDDEATKLSFVYESKFGEEYTNTVSKLYHMTDIDNVDKILSEGLVPKSRSKKSLHPERIYLGISKESFDEEFTDFKNELDRGVTLEVDASNLNLKLYIDPNMNNAVYTYDNINPKYITRID